MKIIPTNDEFEAVLNMPANEVQELMPFHQIFLMEALRYSITGNCEYFLPTYNAECGVIIEPPVDIIISCDGATDSATLTLSENPDFTIPPTGMTFEVNGVQETFVFGDAGIDMNVFHAKFPSLELGETNEVRNNSTTEHLRIRFQGYPPEQDALVAAFSNNPTGGSSDGWATVCLAPAEPIQSVISCDGATDTSGCIDIEGLWDLEIDGERILIDVTPEQMESYLINDTNELTNSPTCCNSNPVFRSLYLPYPIEEGSTIYIPIALTPNGESITTPMVAEGDDPYNNIGEQLGIQLEPHGLYAQNGMFSNANSTSFGIPYYNATNYGNTFFYILDEGNTFSEDQMPRGLPPYRCFFPT